MKTTRRKYADQLITRGLINEKTAQAMMDEYRGLLDRGEQVANVETKVRTNKFAADWSEFDQERGVADTDT